MSDNSISSIMEITMEKLRSVVDAETVFGNPQIVGDITIIPVSKVSFGLATGGSDFPSKTVGKSLFGGGGGAGVTITPVAFLIVKNNDVKLVQIYDSATTVDRAIAMAPDVLDKVKDIFRKEKNEQE